MSVETEWKGSSDCSDEYDQFNKCMVAERRRYQWMDKSIRPPIYDYVQQRIKEKALEDKYHLISEDESSSLKQAIREEQAREQKSL